MLTGCEALQSNPTSGSGPATIVPVAPSRKNKRKRSIPGQSWFEVGPPPLQKQSQTNPSGYTSRLSSAEDSGLVFAPLENEYVDQSIGGEQGNVELDGSEERLQETRKKQRGRPRKDGLNPKQYVSIARTGTPLQLSLENSLLQEGDWSRWSVNSFMYMFTP